MGIRNAVTGVDRAKKNVAERKILSASVVRKHRCAFRARAGVPRSAGWACSAEIDVECLWLRVVGSQAARTAPRETHATVTRARSQTLFRMQSPDLRSWRGGRVDLHCEIYNFTFSLIKCPENLSEV